jgi:ABC-type molybdenum transport system ATPase subunit/photorepair protein PhrA
MWRVNVTTASVTADAPRQASVRTTTVKPWLTASCGPFAEEIRNEAAILSQGVVDWEIPHPDHSAGSVFLGPNGIGKSTLTQALVRATQWSESYYYDDNNQRKRARPKWDPRVQHVSFEAHQELLRDPNLGVYKAVADGGQMNKAAQFLIVRLGLYGLLNRNVNTLSTGEIRKVLLVRALSRRPDLLILDNALDGLDVASREHLKDILRKTLQGFRNDILVQGVSAKAAARTQVMLLTHRPEEVLGDRVTYPEYCSTSSEMKLRTEPIDGRSGEELLQLAMGTRNAQEELKNNELWEDPTLERPFCMLSQGQQKMVLISRRLPTGSLSWRRRGARRWLSDPKGSLCQGSDCHTGRNSGIGRAICAHPKIELCGNGTSRRRRAR